MNNEYRETIVLAWFDTEEGAVVEGSEFTVSEFHFWRDWVEWLGQAEKYPLGPDHSTKWGKPVFVRRKDQENLSGLPQDLKRRNAQLEREVEELKNRISEVTSILSRRIDYG